MEKLNMEKINKTIITGYDWIQRGRYFKYYKYPSSTASEEVIRIFNNGLKEIILTKLKEALERCHELKANKARKLSVIKVKTKPNSFDRYFWSSFIFHEFSEYFVIQKWLRYWLNLWYKISPQSLPQQTTSNWNAIDEWTIQQARSIPIETFYEGRLRRLGSRLVGLCPFHEERTPSFFIFSDNHYHCYGCGAHGDIIGFVMKARGLSFVEAVRYLL